MIILLTWLTFVYMNHSRLYKISIDFYMIIYLYLHKILTNSKYIQMNTKKKQRRQLSSLHSKLKTFIGRWNVCYNTACQYVGSDSKEVLRWWKNLTHGQASKHKWRSLHCSEEDFNPSRSFSFLGIKAQLLIHCIELLDRFIVI